MPKRRSLCFLQLLSLPDIKEKLGKVRYCFSAAASMAKEVVREWKTKTGLDINEAYCMTESASMVTFNHYHHHVIGSVGTPAPRVEIQIRDETGRVHGPAGNRYRHCPGPGRDAAHGPPGGTGTGL